MRIKIVEKLRIVRHQRGIDYGADLLVLAVRIGTPSDARHRSFSMLYRKSNAACDGPVVDFFTKSGSVAEDTAELLLSGCSKLLVWTPSHHQWMGVIGGTRRVISDMSIMTHNGHFLSGTEICQENRCSADIILRHADEISGVLGIDRDIVDVIKSNKTAIFYEDNET